MTQTNPTNLGYPVIGADEAFRAALQGVPGALVWELDLSE